MGKSPSRFVKPKQQFSDSEQVLLRLIRVAKKPKTTQELADAYFQFTSPFNDRVIVGGMLRGIERKANHNRDGWKLAKSKRSGPHPITWWIEKL